MKDITKETIEFELMGQKMVLRSQENPELVREAVELAKLKIKDAEKRTRTGAAHQVALVALLDLAEDYMRTKRRVVEHRRLIDEKTTTLLSLVESVHAP